MTQKYNDGFDNLLAIEIEARRMRAEAIADLAIAASRWIAARFAALRAGTPRSA